MVIIKPFKALRPKKGLEKKIASLPYDVLNTEEAKKIAKGNKYSYLHISKPEIDFPEGINLYSNEVYEKAKENFEKFINKGYLVQDKEEYLYIYKQKMGSHEQIGLVCCVSVDEYDKNIIKRHELTRKDKEEDRTRHIEVLNANDEPVFLTYKAKKEIDKIIFKVIKRKFEYKFKSNDKIEHTFWVIKDRKIINSLIKEFEKIKYLYIADGHHRSASASRVQKIFKENSSYNGKEEYNYFLAVIFPDDQLKILPYNRVIKDLNGLSEKEFLEKVKKEFEIIGNEKVPKKSKTFSMYLNKKWYLLRVKEYDKKDVIESLDVSILQNKLLNKILGIKDPREDKRINFIGGIKGIKELEKKVNSKEYAVAFSLYPISIKEIIKIANSKKTMPPKSTWFEPKLRSGLFVHLLE